MLILVGPKSLVEVLEKQILLKVTKKNCGPPSALPSFLSTQLRASILLDQMSTPHL